MKNLDSSNISITILPPATPFRPVDGRRYTLVHTKDSNDIMVSIGDCFDNQTYEEEYHELLAVWTYQLGFYLLTVTLNMNTLPEELQSNILEKYLEKYLTIIVLGDLKFYKDFPWLLDAPIYVNIESDYQQFNQSKYVGTPRKLLIKYKKSSSIFV
ncbi:staygreen family protein [Pallidibacillus pasinlerensis]|uniref:Staygreen protein domain-containing protein n=1 Tax=Pallidibacillus pasinlerensis TaxID=2703818 RepID=A0ABX0A6W3_9BACI|nr:staygreen family protein [Pallidibacillus pasinlerensis]NCU18557.1 hypothetical protein [Pallidibacillus pasinlerensis]